MKPPKLLTLCFIFKEDKVLLGQKKRGFGEGKWNGFGGKLENGETIDDAMKREVSEEVGIEVVSFKKVGIVWETHPSWHETLEIHIFVTEEFNGVPIESEEMKPRWFPTTEIPYESMWEGDRIWMLRLIAKEIFMLFIQLDLSGKVLNSRSV